MRGYFKMVHFAIRQFDITAISIIFHTGRIGYAMRSGEETCLLIDITHGEIRSICPSLILGKESDIAFNACCILQFTPIDGDSLCQVDNRIRRNMIVAEVLFRITNVRVPGIFLIPSISDPPTVPLTDLPSSVTSPNTRLSIGTAGGTTSITPPIASLP